MIHSTTNLHGVTRIVMQRIAFGTFVSHDITFTMEDGSEVCLAAFAAEPLEIENAGDRKACESSVPEVA